MIIFGRTKNLFWRPLEEDHLVNETRNEVIALDANAGNNLSSPANENMFSITCEFLDFIKIGVCINCVITS